MYDTQNEERVGCPSSTPGFSWQLMGLTAQGLKQRLFPDCSKPRAALGKSSGVTRWEAALVWIRTRDFNLKLVKVEQTTFGIPWCWGRAFVQQHMDERVCEHLSGKYAVAEVPGRRVSGNTSGKRLCAETSGFLTITLAKRFGRGPSPKGCWKPFRQEPLCSSTRPNGFGKPVRK